MCDRFPRKFDVQTSYKPSNICCEHQISSGNLTHNSAFDRRTLLFNYKTTLNFGVLPLVEINHVTRQCLSSAGAYQRIVTVFWQFSLFKNLALYNENNKFLFTFLSFQTGIITVEQKTVGLGRMRSANAFFALYLRLLF